RLVGVIKKDQRPGALHKILRLLQGGRRAPHGSDEIVDVDLHGRNQVVQIHSQRSLGSIEAGYRGLLSLVEGTGTEYRFLAHVLLLRKEFLHSAARRFATRQTLQTRS